MPTRAKSAPITRRSVNARSPHGRAKLSTTVAPENFAFLQSLVNTGEVESLAGAVDLAVSRVRRAENRSRLERATAAYFDHLSAEAVAEEQQMANLLSVSSDLDFDNEP